MKKLIAGAFAACAAAVSAFAGALPAGYEQLEWIQSDGTAWIDTGVVPTNIATEIRFNSMAQQNAGIYGVAYGSKVYSLCKFNGQFTFRGTSAACGQFRESTDYVISIDLAGKCQLTWPDGSSENTVDVTYTPNATYGYQTLYLFGTRNLQFKSIDRRSTIKLMRFRIWQGGRLVRDFIPCRREADESVGITEAIGLYDLADHSDEASPKLFYANNNGSGAFVAGPDYRPFVVADIPAQEFFGQPCTPAVTVTDKVTGELLEPDDYRVDYFNNEAPGTGQAVVTGLRGDYAGVAVNKEFAILQAAAFRVYDAEGNPGAVFGSFAAALEAVENGGAIELIADASLGGSVSITNKSVTLRSAAGSKYALVRTGPYSITLKGTKDGAAALKLSNVIVDGGAKWAYPDDPGSTGLEPGSESSKTTLFVISGTSANAGELELGAGAIIRNVYGTAILLPASAGGCGGVTMREGSMIRDCRAQDVGVIAQGSDGNTLNLEGGTITGCGNSATGGSLIGCNNRSSQLIGSIVITNNCVGRAASAVFVVSTVDDQRMLILTGGCPLIRDNVRAESRSESRNIYCASPTALRVRGVLSPDAFVGISDNAQLGGAFAHGDQFGIIEEVSPSLVCPTVFHADQNADLIGKVKGSRLVWRDTTLPLPGLMLLLR